MTQLFVFTFAHVYNANGILVDELLDKVPDEVLKSKPKERNPYGVVNFAKSSIFRVPIYTSTRLSREALL